MSNIINADNGVVSGIAGVKLSSDSTGVLDIQTNGTTAITISTAQVVSLTNSPTFTGGTANGVLYLNASKVATSGSALTFDSTQMDIGVGGYYGRLNLARSSGSPYATMTLTDPSNAANEVGIYLRSTGTNPAGISTAGAPLAFYNGGPGVSEKMRITAAGLVGIATTSPGVDLEIGSNTSTTRVLSIRYSSVPLYLSGGYDGANALSTFSTNSYNTSNGSATWSAFSNTGYGNSAVQLASTTTGADIRFFTAAAANTNPTERARFNTTGAFVFAGGTTTADGIGITFPATQSASSNANTLDDYEEGTFDPTFTCDTTAPTGVTYTSRTGRYTKIGRVVYIQVAIALSNKGTGGTGFVVIGNLPFTTASDNPFANFGCLIDALASDLRQVSVQSYPGQPFTYLIQGGGSTGGHNGMSLANITNSTQIRAGFFYII